MTETLTNRRLVVVVSGGIAAYKSADLVSRLRRAGAEVRVVMTTAATRFVGPLTFEALSGHPVYKDVIDQPRAWEMEHISWARWGEAVLIAPATANLLAKIAHGLADDAATTLILAFDGPVWAAPAMNTMMWQHAATQHNLSVLRERGMRIMDPGAGPLACGEVGAGRMCEPEQIVATLGREWEDAFKSSRARRRETAEGASPTEGAPLADAPAAGPLTGKTVLVTAGPTREMLDPIRFISNRSTGRMGCDLAAEALARGARVLLVHGPLTAAAPPGTEAHTVGGAREMLEAVEGLWEEVDIAIFAAAVANYESAQAADHKIKGGETLTLELRRTPDIAHWCGRHRRPGQFLVGFAAESESLLEAAQVKLEEKRLDLICANPISEPGIGFAADQNQVTLLDGEGLTIASPRASKAQVAGWIWDEIEPRLAGATDRRRPTAAATS